MPSVEGEHTASLPSGSAPLARRKLRIHFDDRKPNAGADSRVLSHESTLLCIRGLGGTVTEDMTGHQTRLRLLDAGLAVFSEVGYHGATIREIAGRAGTNIAAISYHFGGKDGLYAEVVHAAFAEAAGEAAVEAKSSTDADDRLHRFVRALVCGANDDTLDLQRARLLAWDTLERASRALTRPSGYQLPFVTAAGQVVGDVLGADAAPGERSMLGIWLVGQCLAFQQVRHLLPEREAEAMMTPKVRDAIAEVVYWLARAGLAAYRGGPEAAIDGARLAV